MDWCEEGHDRIQRQDKGGLCQTSFAKHGKTCRR